MKKALSVILTAAMILSLTACSENNTSVTSGTSINEDSAESINNSESVSENSSDVNENLTDQNTPNKVDDTLPQCEPANKVFIRERDDSIMKGEDGYYYSTSYTAINGVGTSYYVLSYYDTKTGKSIPLCSKPQCLHDGDEFCPATSFKKEARFYWCWDALYNNYIYRIIEAKKEVETGVYVTEYKLYRHDLMGNERSYIAELCEPFVAGDDGTIAQMSDAVFHLGKMFYTLYGTTEKEDELYILDLESGERKQIVIPPNEDGVKRKFGAISPVTAEGDYLYFAVTYTKKNGIAVIYDKTVLHRYNIKSGEISTISAMPDIYSSFAINNEIVYYTTVDRAENQFSLYSYDIENDKTVAFAENVQQGYLEGKHIGSRIRVAVFTDRQYLYISTCGEVQYNREDLPEYEKDFYIYSLDGKQLLHGLQGLPTDIPEWSFTFRALEGEIYLNFDSHTPKGEEDKLSGMYTIKTEDLINGSTEWTKLYNSGR